MTIVPTICRRPARSRFASVAVVAMLALGGFVAASVAAPVPASAQAKGKKSKQNSYDFEDDVIETQYLRPDTGTVQAINKDKRRSLIRIRKDFFAELIRSAEDL